jgi:putative ABC transport system permease protein
MFRALSQAWQSWASARAVAALAIAAFAIGIGSATAIYTVVNGVLLKPLPYAHGERFVALYSASFSQPDQRGAHVFPDLIEYQQRLQGFDVFGWFRPTSFNMTYAGRPQHVIAAAVTPSLALNLGVSPAAGQWFGGDGDVVISHSLWQRLGADPAIVGKSLRLDGQPYTITGVMPPGFRLPVPGPGVERARSDLWVQLDPLGKGQNPSTGFNFAYGRRKPGVTFAQAEADVKRVAATIAASSPEAHPSYTAKLDDLRQSVILDIKPTLVLLVAAAGVLLLIACADVAGLLLSRSVARARETAIRIALGAPRRQLALHYFLESLIVSVLGAAAGLGVSALLVRMVLALAADHIPRADEISLDWTVLAFSAVLAGLASALASIAPLWQALRTLPAEALSDGVRASASARSRRLSRALVVAEIALAFTLLTISAVLVTHLRNLGRVSPGFNPDNLVTFEVNTQPSGDTPAARAQHQARYIDALESIPGVSSAAFANGLPLAGCCFSTTVYPEGRTDDPNAMERTSFRAVTPGFFRTLQIPLKSGRLLDDRDLIEDPLQVVINEAAVRANWADRNPVGAYGRVGGPRGSRFRVVGVVGDVRNDGLGKPPVPELYVMSAVVPLSPLRFAVRSTLPADTIVPGVRAAIESVDPSQAIHDVATMREIVARSVSLPRIGSFMTMFFALAALLMATLGIYGVVSYAVRQETVEMGTRMALGAIGRDLLVLIVGSGLKMAAIGAAIGGVAVGAAALILVRVFEIRDLGVLPFLTSTVVVGSVAAVAAFFPAWRATALSPMVAIRNEPGSTWRATREGLLEALRGVSRAFSLAPDEPRVDSRDLLTEFVSAARRASSFAEAFRLSLATLRERMGATSVTLFQQAAGALVFVAASPDEPAAQQALPSGGFLVNRLRSYSYPLPFTSADLESWLRWARENSPAHAEEIATLAAMGARMAIGLRARDEILGVLVLGAPSGRETYSIDERFALRQCAEQLVLMIENAKLTARVVEQEKLRRDLALAAEVQKRLLPDAPPVRSAAALAAVSLPARSVGGDYYDFLDLGHHRIGIALADIAGKGVAAALIMAVVQASLRIVAAEENTSLPELAARINGFLHRSTGSNSYATFFYAQLDEDSRRLTYVNAGHNPPFLFRSSDRPLSADAGASPEIFELNIGGTVLGLFPEMTYEQGTLDLRTGDVLIAFTDGVTEALNATEEEFGEARLKDLLRTVIHLPAAEISARISEELRRWIVGTDQYDDLTFVVMKVT